MSVIATHIGTGKIIRADSLVHFCRIAGIPESYCREGRGRCGDIIAGWEVSVSEDGLKKSRKISESIKEHVSFRAISVDVYDFETQKYLGSYPSLNEAAKTFNVDASSASKVISGARRHSNGYVFCPKGKDMNPFMCERVTRRGHTVQISREGETFIFESISLAAAHIGCHEESLRRNIRLGRNLMMGWGIAVRFLEREQSKFLQQLLWNLRNCNNQPDSRRWNVVDGNLLNEWTRLESFQTIWSDYVAGGYSRELKPCLDRVDPSGSYTSDNIQWLPFCKHLHKTQEDIVFLYKNYQWKVSSDRNTSFDTLEDAKRFWKRMKYGDISELSDRPYIYTEKRSEIIEID